jgi:pyruvate,orthophosphate dikinase
LIAGITDAGEFQRFGAEVARTGQIAAGAIIQNIAALSAGKAMAKQGMPLWIEISEIIPTMYGFPTEVLDVQRAMQEYVAAGYVAANPSKEIGTFLTDLVLPLNAEEMSEAWVGIDCTGCSLELVVELFRRGFTTFSVPPGRRDEVRLEFGQQALEFSNGS